MEKSKETNDGKNSVSEVWIFEGEASFLNCDEDVESTVQLDRKVFATKTLALTEFNKLRDFVMEISKLTPGDSSIITSGDNEFDMRVGHNRYYFRINPEEIIGE